MRIEPDGAYMTKAEFDQLPEYSCTLPTGTTTGKKWKRRVPYHVGPGIKNDWRFGMFGRDLPNNQIEIIWRDIFIQF